MNEEMNKMLCDAHSMITYSSACLNAWANKLESLFWVIVSDRSHRPYKSGMDEMEMRFQAAYDWMEQNLYLYQQQIYQIHTHQA